ncbi:MAG: Holliday junction branch migration protein RuvA [Lachnospiraceae bacterium]|nr:Holliday junction branch migration protein RuvA [Lachnospiraceae bacterium]
MIGFLKGKVEQVGEDYVLIDVGGVGYKVNISTSTAAALPNKGNEVTVYTHLSVREDDMSLFGFLNQDSLEFFKLLITVSGVGPKGALGLLGVLGPDELKYAIMSGDAKSISRAPGIGSRIAQRIILDLKSKVSDIALKGAVKEADVAHSEAGFGIRDQAVEALTALGYSATESYKAVSAVELRDDMDVNELLKLSLKNML